MTRKLTMLFAAILAGLVTTTTVFAEENTPSSTPPRPAHGTGMMGDHAGMMRQISPDQMQQMTRMVDNCNHLMEMTNTPAAPDQETTPNHHD